MYVSSAILRLRSGRRNHVEKRKGMFILHSSDTGYLKQWCGHGIQEI